MDNKTYDRLKNQEVQGRKAILREQTANSYISLPAGAEVTIRRKNNGYEIEGDPCLRCGARSTITHVPPQKLDLIPDQGDAVGKPSQDNHTFLIKVSPAQVGPARALLAQARVNLEPSADQVAPASAAKILQGRDLPRALHAIRELLEEMQLQPRPRIHNGVWTLQEERLGLVLGQAWLSRVPIGVD